jgi:FkbM family methyltransferase
MSVWNGHYACTCYHPLFVFNQFGDLERCALRAGNVHSADGWDGVLKPVVARYQGKASRIYFQVLQSRIGYLLTRAVGRPPHHVRRFHANFSYQAGTWTKPRRRCVLQQARHVLASVLQEGRENANIDAGLGVIWRISVKFNPALGRLKLDNRWWPKMVVYHALNHNPQFTKWVVSRGFLTEPFVLIDVGIQGGEHIRWHVLDDYLVVYGFDPVEEAVQKLAETNKGRPNRHYHYMAVGNADGEQQFYFNPTNPTASSMYQQGVGRYGVETAEQLRVVPIRRLDSLFAEGAIPVADYIKIDVEGFEKEVLLGAHELLGAGVLGLQTETNFRVSPTYPKSHFGTLAEIALESHLVVFDLAFNRAPRASFQQALTSKGLQPISEQDAVGRPATVDVLFARDLIDEVDHQENYQTPYRPVSVNQLIKSIIICELHALNDVALDTVERFAERLGAHLDVDRAVQLLADPDCVTNEYRRQLRVQKLSYEQLSTRLTAQKLSYEQLSTQLTAQKLSYEQLTTQLTAQKLSYEQLSTQLTAQKLSYEQQLTAQKYAYEQSTSWRLTAPLRWTRLMLFNAPR